MAIENIEDFFGQLDLEIFSNVDIYTPVNEKDLDYLMSQVKERLEQKESMDLQIIKQLIEQGVKSRVKNSCIQNIVVGCLTTIGERLNREAGKEYFEVPDFTDYIGVRAGLDGERARFVCKMPGVNGGYKAKKIAILTKKP